MATSGTIGALARRARAFVSARLSPEGELGLYVTIGVLVLVTFAWIFGGVAEDVVTGDPLTRVDRHVSLWFEYHTTPLLTDGMRLVTQLGGWRIVTGLTTAIGLHFAWRRCRYGLIALVLVVPGGAVLGEALRQAFHRARPHWEHPLVQLATASFPSGHAMNATTLYGFLAVCLIVTLESWGHRLAVALSASALVLLIGVSRVYLGAHYPSDVLGGISAGLVWLAVCLTAVEATRRRRTGGDRTSRGKPMKSSVHCERGRATSG
jgi:membrane-associated phospholipid phosphatase